MSSNNLDLDSILYQDQLRSKPVEDNFQSIESNFNALRSEVYAGIASTASEVTSARANMDSLTENIKLRKVYGNRVINDTSFSVAALNTAAMFVQIATGSGIVDGVGVTLTTAAVTSATINTAASGKHRLDAVVIDINNDAYIKEGAEVSTSSAVEYPTILNTELILAHYTVGNTTAAITDAMLTDDRIPALNPFRDWENYDVAYTYNGDTLSTATITDKAGIEYVAGLSYVGSLIASVGITIDSARYTKNYEYDVNENLTGYNYTVSI